MSSGCHRAPHVDLAGDGGGTEAQLAHRPASQILRELMREFVQRQRQARDYDAFLQQKVDTARVSMAEGRGLNNDEVEAAFAARRAAVTSQA